MDTFKRILRYSKPYWWRIVISAIFSMVVGGMDGLFAYLTGPLLKQIFSGKDQRILLLLPLAVIGIFFVRGMGRYINEYFIRTAGQLAVQNIRNDVYRNGMFLGLRFFHAHPTGTLMSRVLNDVNAMQEGVGNVITGLFRDGFGALFLLGMIFYLNWKLAIIAFLVIPLTVVPAQKIGRRIKSLSSASQGKMGDISSILQETFSGIKVIKAFGLEEREIGKFHAKNLEYYRFMRKSIKYEGLSVPVMELLTSLGIAAVIWYGGYQVINGSMKPDAFLSFIAAMILLYNPIKKLNSAYNVAQRAIGAAVRVFEMIDEPRDIVDHPDAVSAGRVKGEVRFDKVSFRYGEDDEPVLREVDLTAGKGEIIALVGPSGSGKTTFVSLIPRFYDVTEGGVTIDGIDVRRIRLRDLMRQIALVDQETVLFNDTIANNIRYGKSDATDAEVEAAARAAYAHDFILDMPEGYETNIGDRGVRLSGGQRQRLCIARAILKDAPILILDEATSALDTESEQMVQEALNNLMANRTTFVIAHRLSTVLHADRIVVLENGRIVESGRHDQLVAQAGLYQKLYAMQFQT
ncbi:lipid A export permease/ATP-binding protein MsbA [Geobacter sp. DSM 9736]|uniref:lipid A export permease/ATP-binding protein MsbA n=1 Tax=Geobacter sp. DSM 9736 TaxID=1277350 RepID=UPI000B50A1A3|nr:lipid A export permease/ATP-binding protein MsbA [Geobacter sp. DSM 9736]SNB45017.1 ATP-binding cassette, subfamily B, MsbA [Geobacter sp. DSM 9736]